MANTTNNVTTGEKRGMLVLQKGMIVQKQKRFIKDDGSYYYAMAVTTPDGNMLTFTGGKICDNVNLYKLHEISFDFIDKKLKLISIKELS